MGNELRSFSVEPTRSILPVSSRPAFSLIEMVMVMAIMTTLMVAGISLLGDTGSKSRRAATDTLSGMIEQGRSQAITGHSQVLLAVAEPGDLPTDDDRCRLGLFKLTEFDKKTGKGKGELLRRWEVINPGVALIGGDAEQFRNVMDEPAVSITYDAGGKSFDLNVHGLVFSQRGGRDWPEGSGSVVMRVAEGGYRGSGKKASANTRGASQTISEDRLKIGRLVARPHSFDP